MELEIKTKKAEATVSTMGGEMVSFRLNGLEYVWTGNPEFWSGHAPVLFPTVGALKERKAEIEGTVYPMKKHGFARKMEFELAEQKEDSAAFSLSANAQTKETYPYDFELRIVHKVLENGFKTKFNVTNTDKRDIVFGIGGHPGFNCPLFPSTSFEEYVVQFAKKEDGPFYYTRLADCDGVIHMEDRVASLEGIKELNLQYALFDQDVLVIDQLKSKKISLIHEPTGKGIEFIMDGFTSLGLWSPPGKKAPFICLEPWTVNPDFSDATGKLKDKPGITILGPGKTFSVSYEVKVID
jgi:Galactose mutarotase and related enzymes